ncbi:metallophosphoesterase [Geothrix sp. 21YS21S-4]|uniref:metallophosphoesterase n=1 Tax=Geothrix sp. 21YS21S-4 TaxID=3068889 RepID=UPI0027B8E4BD|nr:metallophosphoesterase [Geothrix sp. 21YS21S-4]
MRSSHLVLLILGLGAQAGGWALLPRSWRIPAAGAAALLDAAWGFWYLHDPRSLGAAGVWSLSPVATWLAFHLLLAPVVGVEILARLLPWGRWVRFAGLGILLGGSAWGLGEAYGPPVVTEATLAFPDLPPAFDGYRIVLFGDIHAGPYAGTRVVGRWARAVARIPADLVVGAGDFVTFVPEEADRTVVAFADVHPPDGRVGVLGNHDQYVRARDVAERLRRGGWTILRDEGLAIERAGQRLVFLGCGHPKEEGATYVPTWRGKPWPEGFRIGICHGPEQWPVLREEGARLTLAAHTHGGQVNLSPLYNAALERSPYVQGRYEKGADRLFVTRGLGCTGLPIRFRCRPEIVRITLRRG